MVVENKPPMCPKSIHCIGLKSNRGKWSESLSWLERLLDTQEVRGSSPLSPNPLQSTFPEKMMHNRCRISPGRIKHRYPSGVTIIQRKPLKSLPR